MYQTVSIPFMNSTISSCNPYSLLFTLTVTKELKINTEAQSFLRKISVFKDWKEDNQKIINESLNHDLRFWKI